MKRYLAIVLAPALGLPAPASAQTVKDAVVVDPKVHNVVFENDHARIFEARASLPTASPMHSHLPFVFIGLETGRVRMGLPDGKSTMLDIYPGQVMWVGDGLAHSWERYLTAKPTSSR